MTAAIEESLDQVTPFGPDAMLWNLVGEMRTLLVFPSALIMQTMHPMIGAAVGEQSVYRTDPWGRAQRSIDSLCTWVYGGQDAIEEGKRLREMHKPFKGVDEQGRRYHALNGEAYAWVHGTAFERLVAWHRLFGRPLSRAEEKRLYEETLRLGRILRVPEREMPPTVGDYWDQKIPSGQCPVYDSRGLVHMGVLAAYVVVELSPLSWMDVEFVQVFRAHPSDVAGLFVGGGCSASRAGDQHDLVLLTDFAICVGHDVRGIGVDTEDLDRLDGDAGFLSRLSDGAL